MSDPLYVMTPMEVAWGHVVGHIGTLPPESPDATGPRAALERVVRDALQRPPCGVTFSGGRDSSTVLAVAVHVARREGLPEPVPITRVFPDEPESDECGWQEVVVRHLGVKDWHRITIHDELDVVGPLATTHLLEHGIVWPPTIAADVPMVEAVRGGSLIDGEGGDDVFGFANHRVAPLTRLLRAPRPFGWRRVRAALRACAPAPVRAHLLRRHWDDLPMTWLRPAADDAFRGALEREEGERPLSFRAGVRRVPRRRTQVLGAHNRRILAGRRGVEVSSPLLHPDVVHALAREGGVLGLGDRTAVLRALVSDLLPDEVLARTTKAAFTGSYMGHHSRQLVASWAGDGVDRELVDPDELKRVWLANIRIAPTAALLQQVWLALNRPHPPN